ncbi:MAG: tRNA pseudouridine synthase A [Alphaproteobacteria bacterium MarineAlpha5_Bin9]|nr:MAG: tRNA pseudouridine synthase A [Alphaproteobacteria bacterium MarineAlpha5_Bin9]|tara:strand:+ start:14476 stop:15213 length:738 start_codon:yes stop_codon:yes gene_type:complete
MNKYKLTIEYDGTQFVGWQKQKNGKSIQSSIERSIKKISNEKITLFGAGRTDSGVHAKGQSAHFELKKKFELNKLKDGLNFYLRPLPISILNIKPASKKFHARFSAKQRTYEYIIVNRRSPLTFQSNQAWIIYKKLNVKKMKEAIKYFIGKKNFNSFRSINCQSSSSLKTIDKCIINKKGNYIYLLFSAKSFLHSQVRIMVGTLVEVGKENIEPKEILKIIKSKDRAKAGPTAPANGLYLKKIKY